MSINKNLSDMLEYAKRIHLKDVSKGNMLTCIRTTTGTVYSFITSMCSADDNNKVEDDIIKKLQDNFDTVIEYAICLDYNGSLDIPSYDFRQKLCSLNLENKNTILLLQGKGDYILKPLYQTIK